MVDLVFFDFLVVVTGFFFFLVVATAFVVLFEDFFFFLFLPAFFWVVCFLVLNRTFSVSSLTYKICKMVVF